MPKKSQKWQPSEATQAFLVALDISGFSTDPDPDRLLHLRHGFLRSVEKTRLLQQSRQLGRVRVHFLGDELRLAFHVEVGVSAVRQFLLDIRDDLDSGNRTVAQGNQVRLRTVVLAGPVAWAHWHDCHFLDGTLPAKAQFWLTQLAPGEIAIDSAFKQYLDVAGLTTAMSPRRLLDEIAHILVSDTSHALI